MKDTNRKISEAAVDLFIQKGFDGATTQEVAKAAGVAEVTIYRKFKTKENLFISSIKPILLNDFRPRLQEVAVNQPTRDFFKQLLDNRLSLLEEKRELFLRLIAESIKGKMEAEDVNLPLIMVQTVKAALESHFAAQGKKVNLEGVVRIFSGILFGHLVWPNNPPYQSLSHEEKERLLHKYVLVLESAGSEYEDL